MTTPVCLRERLVYTWFMQMYKKWAVNMGTSVACTENWLYPEHKNALEDSWQK